MHVCAMRTTGDATGLSPAALDQIAIADETAFTFTQVFEGFCMFDGSLKGDDDTSAAESTANEV